MLTQYIYIYIRDKLRIIFLGQRCRRTQDAVLGVLNIEIYTIMKCEI